LNVAEKPSVARSAVEILSNFSSTKENSFSIYNPVFSFNYEAKEKSYNMLFTSVTGHMMEHNFLTSKKNWEIESIKDLFKTEINKYIKPESKLISKNLESLGK
jgi:DNA topoisomerase-3